MGSVESPVSKSAFAGAGVLIWMLRTYFANRESVGDGGDGGVQLDKQGKVKISS